MGISDWVVVLAEGQVIAEGRPSAIMSDRAVIDAYLGSSHDDPDAAPSTAADDGPTRIEE
jgi:neutral amino acid transport system ATP-binding protein